MNRNIIIQAKQFVAALLLLVFLLIHAGKMMHVHNHPGRTYTTEASHEINPSPDCAICTFHLAKDGDLTVPGTGAPIIVGYSSYHCAFKSHLAASIGLVYADRGPPSV